MTRKHRKKLKKQRKIIIISSFILLFTLCTGYAAFSTNINLNVKGNIKIIYKTVSFKTNLLNNTDFKEDLTDWNIRGSSTSTKTVDNQITNHGLKSIRIHEEANDKSYNGIYQNIKRPFDTTKKYEVSVYAYKDKESTYGDLTNYIRMYVTLGNENKRENDWIMFENAKNTRYPSFVYIPKEIENKKWNYFEDQGNQRVYQNETKHNIIWDFNIDYSIIDITSASTIWISSPRFYEIQTKQIRKGNKIGTLPIATKEGYTFLGWSLEEDGDLITNDTIIKEDTTLYAVFTKN